MTRNGIRSRSSSVVWTGDASPNYCPKYSIFPRIFRDISELRKVQMAEVTSAVPARLV
jgi:hypothetical protein